MSDRPAAGALQEAAAPPSPDPRAPAGARGATRRAAAPRPRVFSEALFRGAREVVIVHEAREYVLRLTRRGKLILTT